MKLSEKILQLWDINREKTKKDDKSYSIVISWEKEFPWKELEIWGAVEKSDGEQFYIKDMESWNLETHIYGDYLDNHSEEFEIIDNSRQR